MPPLLRRPAVAGRFYPSSARELGRAVDEFLDDSTQIPAAPKISARACLVPHAGYVYSGHVAGAVYREMEIPRRAVLIGPRHYPVGEAMAILSEGKWLTPLAEVPVDGQLAQALKRACPLLREDETAHRTEHSLETQLPFLQRLQPDLQFVPIVLGTVRWPELEALGHALAGVIAAENARVLLVASSDMNHYEPDDITRVKDSKALERLLALDARGLYDTVRSEEISMCGFAAAVVVLVALRDFGAAEARLIRYATSGDVNGDRDEVVGYAGVIFP